jgi:hypothetical protein
MDDLSSVFIGLITVRTAFGSSVQVDWGYVLVCNCSLSPSLPCRKTPLAPLVWVLPQLTLLSSCNLTGGPESCVGDFQHGRQGS